MKVVSLVSWKGGTGKSTLACNLAERAVNAGLETLLCDLDPQQSALEFCARRGRYPGPPVPPPITARRGRMTVDGIDQLEKEMESDRYDLILCDTPGSNDMAWGRCANLSDLLLVPVSPTPMEVMVTRRLLEHCQEKEWEMRVVLNALPSGKKRVDDLRAILNVMDVPVAPVNLGRRVDYWDSSVHGLGVCEWSDRSMASREMQSLWDWMAETLDLAEGEAMATIEEVAL